MFSLPSLFISLRPFKNTFTKFSKMWVPYPHTSSSVHVVLFVHKTLLFSLICYELGTNYIIRLCKTKNLSHIVLSGEHFLSVYVTVTSWLYVGRLELTWSICCDLAPLVHVHGIFTFFSTRKFAMVEFRNFTPLIWQIAQISLPQNVTTDSYFSWFQITTPVLFSFVK